MKVSDVMSTHVEFVLSNAKAQDVVMLIFGRGINGVPVCKDKKVVGFITERDILAKFFPTLSEYIEDPVHEGDFESMEEKVKEVFSLKAEDIMSNKPTTVMSDIPLLQAQSLMLVNKVGRLPVVDKKGYLIGIISKGDIFKALVGDRILFTENQDYNDWLSKTYYAAVDIKNRMQHELPDLLKVLRERNVKTILDVGCGTGDHCIALADKGFNIVGIDRSKAMIKEAQIRKRILSPDTQRKMQFMTGETIKVLSKLKVTFDAVLFMGNTLSHNPGEVKKLIGMCSQCLSKNGIMIFQITNFDKVIKVQKRLLEFNFATLKDSIEREYAFLEFYDIPNKKDHTILKTFAILRSDRNKWKWVGVRNSIMAYTNREIIKSILEKNGFSKISFYGGLFDGRKWDYLFRNPFKPMGSDWLNVVAKR